MKTITYRLNGPIKSMQVSEDAACAAYNKITFKPLGQIAADALWCEAHLNSQAGHDARIMIAELTNGGVTLTPMCAADLSL